MNNKSESTLEKFEEILSFKSYAKSTIRTYVFYASEFLSNFDEDLYHISIKSAINFLIKYPYTSKSQQNQFIRTLHSIMEGFYLIIDCFI